MRSSSGRARRASARETSRRYSKRLNGSRRCEGICKGTFLETDMPIYHTLGQIPRKRHIAFRRPDGGIYAEELMGHEGFTGTSSLLYHTYPPTTVKSAKRLRETRYEADPDNTLRHRHFRTSKIKKGGSPTLDRIPLLFNQDIAMLYVDPDEIDDH